MFFRLRNLKAMNKNERQRLLSQQEAGMFYVVFVAPTVLILLSCIVIWTTKDIAGVYDQRHYQFLNLCIAGVCVFLLLLYKCTYREMLINPESWKFKDAALLASVITFIPWAGGWTVLGMMMIPEANIRLDFSEARPVRALVLDGNCIYYRKHKSDCTSDIYEIESKSRHRITGYWSKGDVLCIQKQRGLFGMAWAREIVQCESNHDVHYLMQQYHLMQKFHRGLK